jgi:hypothetical protein
MRLNASAWAADQRVHQACQGSAVKVDLTRISSNLRISLLPKWLSPHLGYCSPKKRGAGWLAKERSAGRSDLLGRGVRISELAQNSGVQGGTRPLTLYAFGAWVCTIHSGAEPAGALRASGRSCPRGLRQQHAGQGAHDDWPDFK